VPTTTKGSVAFPDAASPPTAKALARMLGRTRGLWTQLIAHLQAEYGPLAEEWNFGKAYGWSFRLKARTRAVVYMTPRRGRFLASFALGEKACAAAKEARLPASMLTLIDDAPKYAEGRGVRIPVRSARDLAGVETLAAIKMAR
jgi:uncharacterized protein DUF3788